MNPMEAAPSVAFLRPCLGVGGSERLALDAAMALQRRGCTVRAFVPGVLDGPQFEDVTTGAVPVTQVATRVPVHVSGRLRAPLAIARTALAARALARSTPVADLIVCDVVAHVVPHVKRLTRRPVIYYCHYPDLLLTAEGARASGMYRTYRRLVDRQEEAGLASADRILVNSRFTASVLREVFPSIAERAVTVVHPGVPIAADAANEAAGRETGEDIVLLSISRFDPRKNLPLAIEALAALRPLVPAALFRQVRLVLAGHLDATLPDQTALLEALRARAARLGVDRQVTFVLSPSSAERDAWLARSRCVIYTPAAEHFGFVPIEAMAAGCPVVAVDHGGPTETIVDGRTGSLCPPTPQAFAEALAPLVSEQSRAEALGRAGRAHVRQHFSLEAFGERLWKVAAPLMDAHRTQA
jgi:alpha-1,3/alpha-1,6-mannosyltransferase